MMWNWSWKPTLASLVYALGFFLGLLPGLLLWYVYYDRNPWLSRHGLAAARFQSIMLFVYIVLVSVYQRCRVTTKEISLLMSGTLTPLLRRPESIFIAALCAIVFASVWLANFVLSMRSAIRILRQHGPGTPSGFTDVRP